MERTYVLYRLISYFPLCESSGCHYVFFFLWGKSKGNLKENSIYSICLILITKVRVNDKADGGLPPKHYKAAIRKFKEYQENDPDPLYGELRTYIQL